LKQDLATTLAAAAKLSETCGMIVPALVMRRMPLMRA
jgi:ABC-type Mn2+/Zn2+ transport system permease subunit